MLLLAKELARRAKEEDPPRVLKIRLKPVRGKEIKKGS
jgi:hypothetical protein